MSSSSEHREIFISYGREPEVLEFVKKLKNDLEENKFTVWLDLVDIPSGSDWHGAIGTGLHHCRALIAVITNKYINSRYCSSELYTADGDRKKIYPVVLEDVDFGASETSRGVKYVISGINWTMFRSGVDDYATSLAKLVQGLRGMDFKSPTVHVPTEQLSNLQLSPKPLTDSRPPAAPPNTTPTATPTAPPLLTQPYHTLSPPGITHQVYPSHPSQPYPPHAMPNTYGGTVQSPPVALGFAHGVGFPPSGAYPATALYPPAVVDTSPHVGPYFSGYPSSGAYPPVPAPYPPTNPSHYPSPGTGSYPSPGTGSYPSPGTSSYPLPGTSTCPLQGTSPYPPAGTGSYLPPGTGPYPPSGTGPYPPPGTGSYPPPGTGSYPPPGTGSYPSPGTGSYPPPGTGSYPPSGAGSYAPPDYPGGTYVTNTFPPSPSHSLGGCPPPPPPGTPNTYHSSSAYPQLQSPQPTLNYRGYQCSPIPPPQFDSSPPAYDQVDGEGFTSTAGPRLLSEPQKATSSSNQLPTNQPLPVVTTPRPTTPIPRGAFRVGTRVEAVDKRFPYFLCVATIMNKKENTVQIHFDGWGPEYDYECASDSIFIHPVGWCEKNGWELQKPKGLPWSSWKQYLEDQHAAAAEESLFAERQLSPPGCLHFEKGMKLEAKDRLNPNLVCVATITDIKDEQLLIHFDGWSSQYDYWCSPGCSDIHPPMWCGKNGASLTPPNDYDGIFKWNEYLACSDVWPAPAYLFTEEQLAESKVRERTPTTSPTLNGFQVGMKLEAKDRANPHLTCVATVADICGGRLLIHFDGWGTNFDYWCSPESSDIHPVGWCDKEGVELQPPNGTEIAHFNWDSYLQSSGSIAAPENCFKS